MGMWRAIVMGPLLGFFSPLKNNAFETAVTWLKLSAVTLNIQSDDIARAVNQMYTQKMRHDN